MDLDRHDRQHRHRQHRHQQFDRQHVGLHHRLGRHRHRGLVELHHRPGRHRQRRHWRQLDRRRLRGHFLQPQRLRRGLGRPRQGRQQPAAELPPGWIDRIELQTGTQCNFQNWKDSDGVDPETPGCHYAYETEHCGVQTNDVFGEKCEDSDILIVIETNPGKDVCHSHAIGPGGVGVGHPDRFSCNAYCTAKYGIPGECRTSENTCGNGVASAYCLCGC